jgi:hypothetical protein
MRHRTLVLAGSVALIVGLGIAGTSGAAGKKSAVKYPQQLIGLWISEKQACPQDGAPYDGDVVMHITSDALQGYEDRSKPTRVKFISSKPMAWKIESVIDVGPSGSYERDAPSIFVLGTRTVTVVTEDRTEIYKNCAIKK